MPDRDSTANNAAIVANWCARELEHRRIENARDGLLPRLTATLSGPVYDTPKFKEDTATTIGEVHTRAELKAVAAFVKLDQKSRSRIFRVLAMVNRSQAPNFISLTKRDLQLLRDLSEVRPLGCKIGPYALATKLKERYEKRYKRDLPGTLKKQIERVFAKLRKP